MWRHTGKKLMYQWEVALKACRSLETEQTHLEDRAGREGRREDRARRAQPQACIAGKEFFKRLPRKTEQEKTSNQSESLCRSMQMPKAHRFSSETDSAKQALTIKGLLDR